VFEIMKSLVVGVGVDCGHGSVVDADGVVDDFYDWCHAICGAGRVRDDIVEVWYVILVVDSHK